MRGNGEPDSAGVQAGISLAEVVVGESFAIWELRIAFSEYAAGTFLKHKAVMG